MSAALDRYLDRVMGVADYRDEAEAAAVRAELEDHLLEKVDELKRDGLERAEAIIQAIEDHGNPVVVGYRLRKWSLIDVRTRGTARGVIAIGPRAVGIFAFGGIAIGLFSVGACCIGLFSLGGFVLGLFGFGLIAAGGVAHGMYVIGLIAIGGMVAVGVIAAGATGIGFWVPSTWTVISYYSQETVPQWLQFFDPVIQCSRQIPDSKVTIIILFIVLLIIPLKWLQLREYRRIKKINPSWID